ncbi:MAG: LysM peptidoglycan-binding domain-containing protein [Fidelibacterota bacterium]
MKNGIIASILAVFLVSCGKQTAPPLNTDSTADSAGVNNTSARFELPKKPNPDLAEKIEEKPGPVTIQTATADVENSPSKSASDPKEKLTGKITEPSLPEKTIPVPNKQKSPPPEKQFITEIPETELEIEPKPLFPEKAWDHYMVLPGDYLIKIAKKEYDDFSMWRKIYVWNKTEIGDNPNLIYPYHFLKLLKDRLQVQETVPQYFTYSIQPGDNLWNIAEKQYGDPKAWIILLKDNEGSIQEANGLLIPGNTLKLRQKLDPKV